MNLNQTKIVLASASPRRRMLLEQIGLAFEVRVSHVDEKVTTAEPGLVVEELSRQKAEAVLKEIISTEEDCKDRSAAEADCKGVLVIGADTVVAVDGQILGKPSNEEEAIRMLERLSGRCHEVYTGVTLLYHGREHGTIQEWQRVFHEVTKVHFYPMSRQEISCYVASGDCMDKAGAYGIQGLCARYIQGIEGDYNNVVGLPVGRIYQEIALQ